MRTILQTIAGSAIIVAAWWVTDSEHHVGLLIGLLVAGLLPIAGRSAPR